MCLVTPSFNLNDIDMLAYSFYYCKQKKYLNKKIHLVLTFATFRA